MDLDARQLATHALTAGKQHVKGTRDVSAYLVGKCDCEGDQDGKRAWFAYDAGQVVGVAQGFVAHVMRRHEAQLSNPVQKGDHSHPGGLTYEHQRNRHNLAAANRT
jgi:hypothetical protein